MPSFISKTFILDAAERVFFTFLAAFASALVLDHSLGGLKIAALAGGAAAFTAVKSLLATSVGSTQSAGFTS